MTDPVVWLGASLLLVAASLALLLVAALPAIQEIARAARSAEKLFDLLSRELPPTLAAIRLTGSEITSLTDGVNQNVQTATRVVGQLDQSLSGIKQQAEQAQTTTRRFGIGLRAAWQSLTRPAEAFEPEAFEPEAFEPEATYSPAELTDSQLTPIELNQRQPSPIFAQRDTSAD